MDHLFYGVLLGKVRQKRVPGLDAVQQYDKLLILGKPGAGKTTFLKWLAIQCNAVQIQGDRVPLFVTLKEFAEAQGQPTLLEYLAGQFWQSGVYDEQIPKLLLERGRSLVLLDGLDEVRQEDHDRVLQEIENTTSQFHASQFVMTCRIAAREYTFAQFTEVEVADFDEQQINDFAYKWFQPKDPVKAKEFPQELKANPALKELATNPLLLTLLCLVFEERASFPANRSELYKEGLDVLLKKWDAKRNIKRDQVYKYLSLQRKEDLLSQIAFTTFDRSDYFFKQSMVEHQITQYIRNLPGASTDPDTLHLDSEAVLKSIEAQHGLLVERARGIYSFSHLTFQEYFTARRIKAQPSDERLQQLVCHITEKRWREVFLLTVGMMESADSLLRLMKQQTDQLLAADKTLQQFLTWVKQKSGSVQAPYKPAAVRAFYFALDLDLDLARALDLARDLDLDPALQRSLQALKNQLPEVFSKNFRQWWKTNGTGWTEELRTVVIEYRNIGHDWQFSDSQMTQLQQYYDANKLLVDCLNSDCYVSREVRAEIEESLLLPVKPQEQ